MKKNIIEYNSKDPSNNAIIDRSSCLTSSVTVFDTGDKVEAMINVRVLQPACMLTVPPTIVKASNIGEIELYAINRTPI